MPNPYKGIRGIKTKVEGHKKIGLPEDIYEYDSRLEARCAQIFIKHGIRFKPHVRFDCFDKNIEKGIKKFTYTVDFLFELPQSLLGISPIVDAIEVKGRLKRRDLLRIEALEFFHEKRTYIATETLIDLWERDGIQKKEEGV
ncbi:MAG: hypothetical protein A3I89_01650 [Candidatus Harrisonbacteria bacterium RIFCSPLOWO2_02_FULL_41_11]|uniref:DUF1064 domain-containing protein n=1 Tax=Candidatus Harrisonbacteria bacterium RIFCSPHIGHO2_02_FULL_42_16 TaxID=1798404 RepID=A0A1G1ZJI8_9BACT|nr:MAG: hypothetical protein A3B92_00545 [Candidatus Harrisonbacteria bacterium RIFCSPHIGHO2_02_FULL_42_16]OGY67444.1 MAG: hypothetical protein A3I89_01650 [Candidatus Harrisonbacteria bacterium RIFCSPLOWO2_02_FULL_41_11]